MERLEPERPVARGGTNRLGDEHLAGSRVVGNAGGDVYGAAELVAVANDHGAGVDAHPRGRKPEAGRALDESQRRRDRPAGLLT